MLPWRQMLFTAQNKFQIDPKEFWSLSLMEWTALQGSGGQFADQKTLQALMAQYPDVKMKEADEYNTIITRS